MSVMVRVQFKAEPLPATMAAILAAAAFDPSYQDADTLRDSAEEE